MLCTCSLQHLTLVTPMHSDPKLSSVLLSLTCPPLEWPYDIFSTILFGSILCIHTPLATGRSTHRSCDVPLVISKGVAERSGGDHMKQVLSPSSFEVSVILQFSFITHLLFSSLCSPFTSLCTRPNIPDPFLGSKLFVPQMPLPTCTFPSLVIISLLLVILAL